MKKVSFFIVALVSSMGLFAQSLDDAKKEIDNENYFKARQILFKLMADPTQNKADVAYYLGNALLKSDDADSAKLFYKMAFTPESKTPLGYVAAGRLALINKNITEADQDFARASQVTKGKNAEILYEVGDAYFRPTVTNVKQAIFYLEQAVAVNSKNATYQIALGDAYIENSASDNTMGGKAMTKYENAIDINPNSALAWIKKGRLSLNGRIYDDAIDAFNKALKIDQSYPVVYKELATAYYYSKQYDKFKENYQKYIQLSPGDNQAKETIINIYFQGKDYDNVINEATKGLQNDPNNYIFYRALGYADYEKKQYKDANDAMQKFWANPNKKVKDLDIIYSARIAAAMNDTVGAINYFQQALAKDSANCDLIGEYAKVLYGAQHYTEAIAQYNLKKDKCGKLSSLEVYYLGRTYVLAGDSIMADTTFGEFISRNPTSPDGYFQRARVNLKIGKAEDFMAYPYYQKYIEVATTSADPSKYKKPLVEAYDYSAAYYLEKTKDKAKAKEYLMKALELDPGDEFATGQLKDMK